VADQQSAVLDADTRMLITPGTELVSGATMSQDGVYRYRLWRTWGRGDPLIWIMLNPSTADAEVDDPTIRRCVSFAKREKFGGIEVVNLYALRSTDPKAIAQHPDPVGPFNWIHWQMLRANHPTSVWVAAWGAGCPNVMLPPHIVDDYVCLGRTRSGAPRHPLYVRADTAFVPYYPRDTLDD